MMVTTDKEWLEQAVAEIPNIAQGELGNLPKGYRIAVSPGRPGTNNSTGQQTVEFEMRPLAPNDDAETSAPGWLVVGPLTDTTP